MSEVKLSEKSRLRSMRYLTKANNELGNKGTKLEVLDLAREFLSKDLISVKQRIASK
jgi:hypothetical protein